MENRLIKNGDKFEAYMDESDLDNFIFLQDRAIAMKKINKHFIREYYQFR